MFINLYIARPTYHFILIYTCGFTVVIKRICYVNSFPFVPFFLSIFYVAICLFSYYFLRCDWETKCKCKV